MNIPKKQDTVNQLFSTASKNQRMGIVPIDRSRLAEQTDTNKNLKMCTQSEKNWLTVSSSNPNPHGLVLSYTVIF